MDNFTTTILLNNAKGIANLFAHSFVNYLQNLLLDFLSLNYERKYPGGKLIRDIRSTKEREAQDSIPVKITKLF